MVKTDSITPVLPSAVLRAKTALEDAIGAPVQTWERPAPGSWKVAGTENPASSPLEPWGEQFDRIESLLEEAIATGSVRRTALTDGLEALAAPLCERAGNVRAVALTAVDAATAPLLERLAGSVLKDIQQSDEIEWLRDENFVFSQQVTDDFEELTFLRSMATHLVVKDSTLKIGQLVDKTIAGMREMIGAEAIFFVEHLGEAGYSVANSCWAKPESAGAIPMDVILQLAAKHVGQAESMPFVRNDLEVSNPEAFAAGIKQFLLVTIATSARNFGWFVALNRCNAGRQWSPSPLLQIGQDEFGTWEASLLSTAATLVASHASNLELIREKERLLINTVRSLVSALDSKDTYTRGHSERVALYSKRISESMGYDNAAAERLYLSGLLHDVGKIGVSDATLRKPGKLTDEEYEEIRKHPDDGWAILRDLEQLNYVLPGVLHHHEQVDGSGYPDRLVGEQIPQDARIMAVADAYDAMTSDRAYRAGMPHEKAIGIIASGAGTQWDATVVDAFLSVIDDITTIRYTYQPHERPVRSSAALAPHCLTT
jgi:hypothetical protein